MVHKVYTGDVVAGEAVEQAGDVKPLEAFRVKSPDGSYSIVLAGSEAEARAAFNMGGTKSKK